MWLLELRLQEMAKSSQFLLTSHHSIQFSNSLVGRGETQPPDPHSPFQGASIMSSWGAYISTPLPPLPTGWSSLSFDTQTLCTVTGNHSLPKPQCLCPREPCKMMLS